MRIAAPYANLLHSTPQPEQVIELAGRLCYKSEGKMTDTSAPSFIKTLMSKHHESVIEHASAGFIVGTDRGISHELVRHRLASYSQSSSRYCNYCKDKFGREITVVKPIDIPDSGPIYNAWYRGCESAEREYMLLIESGVRPQTARSVLPTCLFTEIAMTANLREWRHFIKMRTSAAAHPDMRIVANLILSELRKIAPTIFEDL